MPVLDYVQGMLEGILLYGKHNFQTVGADISEDGYFAGLSEADQQTTLKLGRELRAEETRQKTERVREAIERAKAEREKSSEVQKNTAEDGGEEKRSFSSEFEQKTYDSFGITKPRDSVHVQKQVMKTLVEEGFFTDSENRRTVVVNKGSGMEIEINRSGIKETFDRDNFALRGRFIRIAKLATVRHIDEAIEKGELVNDDVANEHDSNDFNKRFAYIEYQTKVDETPIILKLSIKKSQQKNKFWVHSVYIQKSATNRRTNTENRVDIPYILAGTNNSIPQNSEIVKTEGKVFFDDSVELSELTEKQRVEVEYAGNVISAVIGNEIHFFDSRHVPADSREARTNGWYDPADGSIHLDIAKIENGEKSVLFSLSHELVHFIEDWSSAKYQTFADFLMKNYAEHGVSTQALLERKMAELKTNDADYAMSELVADACERMLLDSKASEKLADLNKTDKGLVAKIKSFLSNTLKKIRQAYAQYKGREEAQLLQKMEDKLSEFHALFEDALTDAAQNYRDADGKLGTAEVREQAKIFAEATDTQRYEILKNKELFVSEYSGEHSALVSKVEDLPSRAKGKAERVIRDYADLLGFINTSLTAKELDIDFQFSKNNGLKESLSQQLKYGGDYHDFAKAIAMLPQLLENSVLIEVHDKDRYEGTVREDPTFEAGYVLLSAFSEGGFICPVKFEIKQRKNVPNALYVVVSMTKIKRISVLGSSLDDQYRSEILLPDTDSTYSIAQIIQNVNPKDRHFLKYLPDQMLNPEQINAKKVALEEDQKKLEDLKKKSRIKEQQKQTSNRAILADLLEESIDTSTPEGIRQADILDGYRASIGEIEDLEERVRDLSADIKAIAFSTGKREIA